MIEREQKFLLKDDTIIKTLSTPKLIDQGYLFVEQGKHLRIRIINDEKALLTVKHSIAGTDDRHEFEYKVPIEDGRELMNLCPIKLRKLRYSIPDGLGRTIILDDYPGLDMKVIEIEYEDEIGPIPEYCGNNVSNHGKYSNIAIAKEMSKI